MKDIKTPTIFDVFGDLQKRLFGEIAEIEKGWENEFETGIKPGKETQVTGHRWGYSSYTGPDGKTTIKEWDQPLGQKPQIKQWTLDKPTNQPGRCLVCGPTEHLTEDGQENPDRKPVTEVIENGDTVTIIAELPGVKKGDIKLETEDDKLSITAKNALRHYDIDLKIPPNIIPGTEKARYKNGVLEIKYEKKKAKKGGDSKKKEIKIE